MREGLRDTKTLKHNQYAWQSYAVEQASAPAEAKHEAQTLRLLSAREPGTLYAKSNR